MDDAIIVKGLSKAYKMYDHPRHRLLEAAFRGRRVFHKAFWAVKDVSFRVPKGSTVGIIGINGSGKSTLLQIIAGIMEPTAGSITVQGRVSSLLELGSGFNFEFSGRENVIMNGAIMGFSREEMLEKLPLIEAFAEIGDFIDQPVKFYSSGMLVRLAFSAAIQVDPDILIVDEALAVGDAIFQHRCVTRIKEFQKQGKTVLFVSHDIGAIKSVSSEVVFLHEGRVQAIGDPSRITNLYHAHIARLEANYERANPPPPATSPSRQDSLFRRDDSLEQRANLFRHGSGSVRVQNVELLNEDGASVVVAPFNTTVTVRLHLEFFEDTAFYIIGYIFRDKNGSDISGTNTLEERTSLPPRSATDTLVIDFTQRLPFLPGTYSVTAAVAAHRDSPDYFDWLDNALVFELLPPPEGFRVLSKVWLPVDIVVHK